MLYGLFEATLSLRATYGHLKALSFYVSAEIQTYQLEEKMKNAIINWCKESGQKAERAISKAQEKVDKAVDKVNAAKGPVNKWQADIKAWQDKLQVRSDELERKKKALDSDSCKARCGKVCIGSFGWNPRCWSFFGLWAGCPTWISCFWKIPDIFCIAGCELSKLATKFVIWIEKVTIKIQQGLGEVGIALGDMAKGILTAAAGLLEFGKTVLEWVKAAVNGILDAVIWLAKNASKIFNLRKLKLWAQLTNTFDACLGYEIDCTIFGFDLKSDGSVCLNINFLKEMIYGVTETPDVKKTYPGLKDIKKTVETTEGKLEAVDDMDKKLEEDKSEVEKEVNTETAKTYEKESRRSTIPTPELEAYVDRLPKRTTVPTKEQMKYINAINEPIPEINVRNEFATNAFATGAPWVVIANVKPAGLDSNPEKDHTETGSVRSLDFDSEMNSCQRIKKALLGYEDVSSCLMKSAKNMINGQKRANEYKRSMLLNQQALHNEIKHLERNNNLTTKEREDAYHWYNVIKDGTKDYAVKSDIAFNKQDQLTIPIIRRQLNFISKKEKGKTFVELTDEIHKNAMKGYKRSSIPTPDDVDGEEKLVAIKKDIVSIISNDVDPITALHGKVKDVHANIRSMIKYTKHCRSN